MPLPRFLHPCLALLLASVVPAGAMSQTASITTSQITGPIKSSALVAVPNSKPAAIAHASDLGTVSNDQPMNHVLLVLQGTQAQQAAAEQYLIDVQNPNSSSYRHWLTPAQYGAKFGPSASDRQQIASWLKSQGFTVNSIATGGGWIDFSGTAGSVQSAFHTSIHSYKINGVVHSANNSDISIPSALSGVVSGVVRLNNLIKPTPIKSIGTVVKRKGQAPIVTNTVSNATTSQGTSPQLISSTGDQLVTPGDLQQIYDTASLNSSGLDGTGVTIAVIGRSNVELTDMQSFRQLFGLPANNPQVVLVGPDPGLVSGDEMESALDLEYAGALAPKATIKFVIAQSTDTADGVDLAASYAVDNLVAPIISESYGECEGNLGTAGNLFYKNMWQQAAAEGISVLISSGDNGSAGCDAEDYAAASDGLEVSGLSSTPYNTSVGGTMFMSTALSTPYWNTTNTANFTTAVGYVPETSWNETCDPTMPVVANGNCSTFSSDPRFAYNLNYAGSGGASSCITPTVSTVNGNTEISCSGAYSKPSWQSAPGVPTDGVRDIPDVAFTAAGNTAPYIICYSGSCQYTPDGNGSYDIYNASTVGGTSAATPLFAGMVALLNQQYSAPQGLLNYKLYQLANKQAAGSCVAGNQTDPSNRGTCVFHDVTTGSNAVPCYGGTPDCNSTDPNVDGVLTGYSAGAGYDQATGLGSIDAANLINAWGNISLASSATTLTATPVTANHGTNVVISGTVAAASGSAVPSGDVSLITSTGESFGPFTLTSGSYTATLGSLPGGSYTIYTHYAGDGSFSPSDSSTVSMNITAENSTTTVAALGYSATTGGYAAATSASYGDNLLFRANVAGASGQGTPTGTVSMKLDGALIGTYTVTPEGSVEVYTGTGTNPGIYPAVGSHTLTASFSGDSSFNASTAAAASFTINKGATYSSIAGTSYSPIVNQQVLLTGYVVTAAPGLPTVPTGTVQFYDNGVAIGTPVSLATSSSSYSSGGSQAVLPWTFTTAGSHDVTLSYAGDKNFTAPATNYDTDFTVTAAKGLPNTVTVAPTSVNPSLGQVVTFTIGVAASSTAGAQLTPTGTVTLSGGTYSFSNQAVNTVTLTRGGATLNYSFPQAGSMPVIISYSGDSNFAPSSSTVIPIVVKKATPTATLTPSTTLAIPGSQVTLQTLVSASSNSNGVPYATGAVQYYDSVNGAQAVALSTTKYLSVANGSAAYQTNTVTTLAVPLAAGTHSIYAVYAGDYNYNSVQTAAVTVVISAPDFTVTAPSAGITLSAGSSATEALTVAPVLGLNTAVAFSCDATSLPAGISCAVSPSSVAGASGTATVTLSTSTPGTVAQLETRGFPMPLGAVPVLALTGVCITLGRRRRKQIGALALSLTLSCVLGSILGCADSGLSTTTTTLTTSSAKIASGSTLTLDAAVVAKDGRTPTGAVTFSSDGASLGQPAAIVSGAAKLDTNNLTVGVHTLTATYVGDTKTSSSNSNKFLQAVTGSTTVRIIATSGSITHTVTVPVTLQ